MEDLTPLQAFRRICNLRMLAGVYYFCLLHAISRSLTWLGESDNSLTDALFDLVRFSRQSLLTGVSLLLMVALAEALLAGRRWKLPAALTVQALAVGLGAALGTYLRYVAAAMDDIAKYPEVLRVEYVTPEQALVRARKELGEFNDVFEAGVLPGSIDIRLRDGFGDPPTVKRIADSM